MSYKFRPYAQDQMYPIAGHLDLLRTGGRRTHEQREATSPLHESVMTSLERGVAISMSRSEIASLRS
jgi:hypothetical protein